MSLKQVELGQLIAPAKLRRAGKQTFPILSMTMHGGLVDQSIKFKKRVASVDISPYKVVKRDQLVIGFPIDEGVLSFQTMYDEAIVSPAYDIWDIKKDRNVESRYLERFLRSPHALVFYSSKLRGTTARRRTLPDDIFLTLPVPLPPRTEQQRIVNILDKADALRIKRRAALAKLDTLAQSIFIEMFGDPANNPKAWPIVSIRDLLSSANYGTSKKASTEGSLPMLRMNNITYDGKMDLKDLKYIEFNDLEKIRYGVCAGDILFNRTNSPDLVGKTAVFRSDREMTFAGYLIRLRTNQDAMPDYISGFLNSRHGKATLRQMCKSIIGMANINATEVQSIRIPKPPKSLQVVYTNSLKKLMAVRDKQASYATQLDVLFTSLQHRAFQGKL